MSWGWESQSQWLIIIKHRNKFSRDTGEPLSLEIFKMTQRSPEQCDLNSLWTCFEQQDRLEIFQGLFQPGQLYEL